jgi:flagellar hook-associated protein 2
VSINWSSIYTGPVGQILSDFTPSSFTSVITEANNTQLSQLESQSTTDSNEISAWTTLKSDAQSVSNDLTTLSQASTFQQLSATSSNQSVATAVDNSAQAGSYQISVGSVASSEVDQGSASNLAVTNPAATLMVGGANLGGSFSIQVGNGSAVSVSLPSSGISLNGLAQLINTTPNMGVTASVEQLANQDWVLAISANSTGQAITYTDTAGSGQSDGPLYYLGITGASGGAASNIVQQASPAEISFGSTFNAANAVTSSTNTFNNVIPGLTLTVAEPGTTTINIAPNIQGMTSSVQQFVSDWNQWVSDTANLADPGSVTASTSGKSYSYTANANQVISSGQPQSVVDQAAALLAQVEDTNNATYQNLSAIGITFNSDGSLSLNQATLGNALSTDTGQVASLFQSLQQSLVGSTNTGTSSSTPTGLLPSFYEGSNSISEEAIGYLTTEEGQLQSQVTMMKSQVQTQEDQAIVQYGQWVSQVAQYAQENTELTALFNADNGTSSSSSG